MRPFYVYILSNFRNGTTYVGVTNDLGRRIHEHREGIVDGFTKKYRIKHLVYYEEAQDAMTAISREKRLKKWNRSWKLRLINEFNPDWRDLSGDM